MTARDQYSNLYLASIKEHIKPKSNQIIVILGDTTAIKLEGYVQYITDLDTFQSTSGAQTFTKEWFAQVFSKISVSSQCSILSYAQYSYLVDYLSEDFFSERTLFLVDNLRSILPLQRNDFIADTEQEDDSNAELPCYQADQYSIEGEFFYSVRKPDAKIGKSIPVFTETYPLQFSQTRGKDLHYIDPFSDAQSIDIFLSHCIEKEGSVPNEVYVKHYPKQTKSDYVTYRLELLNSFLGHFGKSIALVAEDTQTDEFHPSKELIGLLRQYWGENASFRDIKIYKNPDIDSKISNVSQGRIVQTLIDEYENVRAGREYRDILLTAPTGAGKSLLFQLPAFYISNKGDVTIVISPLIALMKDQVKAIQQSRGFQKVAFINSEVSLMDRESIISKCQAGEIDILYMAPELLMSYSIDYFIGSRRIGLMVIDEAHLITTWGRDFRVDYWYIGNHIHKIRKYSEFEFPLIAVTATAVYGGDKNDMVFDTVDSLMMHTPHYFIGIVKRDDIEFLINNYDGESKGFDNAKVNQTVSFIREVNQLGFKTLVYAPYREQVRKITDAANADEQIAVKYYGSDMDPLSKEQAEQAFRLNEKNVMVCTKAFGMGVDIPDIQVVYHHAPSGLLPDYVQEIGRVARAESIRGFAALNYSSKDQRYSKQLYGMSSLKLFQLKAVLKKIYQTYKKNGNKRNMLLSVDDFAFAFNDMDDVGAKVKTALMMIEKDYLAKVQYNVVLARPKQLFVKVFAKVAGKDWKAFENSYNEAVRFLSKREDGSFIVRLDLDIIWNNFFTNQSFPVLKRKFYSGSLFPGLDVTPQIKVSYAFEDKKSTLDSIQHAFDILKAFFTDKGSHFFEKDHLIEYLKKNYKDRVARQLASFTLASFSGRQLTFNGALEENAFLQEKTGTPRKYRVFNSKYEATFASTIRVLGKLLESDENNATRYISKENSAPYVKIGQMMEILELGSFEILGGESPMMFIRVNNPNRVRYDCYDQNYRNILLEKTQEKHAVSIEIMDHFFTRSFSNEERWSFIEDFFLGENNEELMRKYPGRDIQRIDIIERLKKKSVQKLNSTNPAYVSPGQSMKYPPHSGKYMPKDHLTIEVNGEYVTKTIKEWINDDPISLHPLVKDKIIYVDVQHVYQPLMNRLQVAAPQYYTRLLELKKIVSIPGWKEPVMAENAMNENPLKFYKWWASNREKVFIPLQAKVTFFEKVYRADRTALQVRDRKLISAK